MPALFSSFVWHLAGMRFVQVDRLERGFLLLVWHAL